MSFTDVEDEPDKLRRNTLMLSVFTVVFNFLGVKFPPQMFGFELPAGSDPKIWILMMVFSIYFFARYHFSLESEQHSLRVSDAKKALPLGYRQAGVNLMLWLYRRNARWNFLAKWIAEAVQNVADERPEIVGMVELESVTVGAYDVKNARAGPNLLGYVFIYVGEPIRTHAHSYCSEIIWPRWFAFLVWIRVRLSLLTNARFIVNVYIPYALFVGSLLYTGCRFWGINGWL